ncbi:MAG TPA: SDR family oxidoreductase [Bdellovibrionales bacterium]|nr:SDR family oxidoreductase [Bdellovibrionales bacterium]
MSKDFSKSILVTGGGSGIGRAIAERFLNEGYGAILVGRRKEPLEEVTRQFQGRAIAMTCDLTSSNDIAKLATALGNSEHGKALTVLVNNAGIYWRRAFKDSSAADWQSMFETNFFGAVRLTQALLPLIEKNKGAIINVASTLGNRPVAGTSAYSASKAAMINWTQSLALELAPAGVRVNTVSPGIVDTPIHDFHKDSPEKKRGLDGLQPLGRLGKPEDIAHAAWSLAGPGSEWITGSCLTVDGGISLA